MEFAKFPGGDDEIPAVDQKFPSVRIEDGILTLAESPDDVRSTVLDDAVFERVVSLSRDEIDNTVLMTQRSNSGAHLSRVLLDYRKALGDSPSELDAVLVGLTVSRLKNYTEALISEQTLDAVTAASLQTVLDHARIITGSLRPWKEFELLCQSLEIDAAEVKASDKLLSGVTLALEEAADLVSPKLVIAIRDYELSSVPSLDPSDRSTQLMTLAKQQVVNNVIVSLLREIRSLQNEKEAWPAKMLGARVFAILRNLNLARSGSYVFGWMHYAVRTIKNLF